MIGGNEPSSENRYPGGCFAAQPARLASFVSRMVMAGGFYAFQASSYTARCAASPTRG